MKALDVIVLIVVLVAIGFALYSTVKNRKKGGCCGNCNKCSECTDKEKHK